jgi:hypothetical protein
MASATMGTTPRMATWARSSCTASAARTLSREGRPGGVFEEGEPPETQPRKPRLQKGGVLQEDLPQPSQQGQEFLPSQVGVGDAAGSVVGHGGVYPGPQLRRQGRRWAFLAPP